MLESGSLVMHGTAGVCRVEGYQKLDGLPGEYMVLCPVYLKDATFYTPTEGGRVKMRPVMTREEADSLIARMPEAEPYQFASPNDQKQRSAEIMKSGDSFALARLTKTVYRDQRRRARVGKKLSSTDSGILKQAERLLFGELAIVLGIPYDSVVQHISSVLEEQPNGAPAGNS